MIEGKAGRTKQCSPPHFEIMKHYKISDREVYPALWITLAALIVGYLLWRSVLKKPSFAGCLFYTRWHVYCPACGGTRAALSLLHGKFLQSFYFNPAVPIAIISVAGYLFSQTVWRIRGKKGWVLRYSDKWLLGFVGLLFLHCLVRNLLWFGCGIPI